MTLAVPTFNQGVASSIPARPTNEYRMFREEPRRCRPVRVHIGYTLRSPVPGLRSMEVPTCPTWSCRRRPQLAEVAATTACDGHPETVAIARAPETRRSHRLAFPGPAHRSHTDVRDEAKPVVEQHVAQIRQRLASRALPLQPRLRVGRSLRRVVAPVLAVQIDRRIPRVIERPSLWFLVRTEALAAHPGLQSLRAIHRDALLGEQAGRTGLTPDRVEERSGNLTAQQRPRFFEKVVGCETGSRHPLLRRQLVHPSARLANQLRASLRSLRDELKPSGYVGIGVSSPLAAFFGTPRRIRLPAGAPAEPRVPVQLTH